MKIKIGGQFSGVGAFDFSLKKLGIDFFNVYQAEWDKTHEQSSRVYDVEAIAPTIHTMGGGNQEPKILQKARGFNEGGEHKICPSITCNSWQENNHLLENRIRKLKLTSNQP
jgi:diketogulonate reductase-like aldo/keto reductase